MSQLNWTMKPPIESGYYWTMNPKYKEPIIEEVKVEDGVATYYVQRDDQYYIYKEPRLFAGPIKPPQFTKA